jgi:hypothetical protein
MEQAASLIGYSQSYLTQLENGTEKLSSKSLIKCLKGYSSADGIKTETKLELLYEMLQMVETVEFDLTNITIVNRDNLLRFFAELLLNDTYPLETIGCIPWNRISGYIDGMREPPPKIDDFLRIVSQKDLL